MPLPKRIKAVDLAKEGFALVDLSRAKHSKWNSFRYLCGLCGDYVNSVMSARFNEAEGKYCPSCRIKLERDPRVYKG